MKKFIILFAALAAVLSCTKENPSNYNPVDGTYSVTLTASAPGADTKTTLVDGEGTKFVHWSKGDAIKVLLFPNRSNGNVVTGPNGVFTSHFDTESSDKAYFRTDSWSWAGVPHDLYNDQRKNRLASTGIAVYPSTATAFSNKTTSSTSASLSSEVSFVLPEEQNAVVGNIESGLNFSYADVNRDSFINTVDKGSKTELQFKNACALIQLTMPVDMSKKVMSISITSNNKVALTGNGSLRLNYYKDAVDGGVVDVTGGAGVVLNSSTGFEAGATYYAVVWPGAHNSGLTIEFTAEDGSVATKTTPGVTLTASKVKPYTFNKGLDFESSEILPQPGDFVYDDGTWSRDRLSEKTLVGLVCYCGDLSSDVELMKKDDSYNTIVVGLADQKYHVVFCNGTTSAFYTEQLNNNKISSNPSSTICGYTLYSPWIQNSAWAAVNGSGTNYASWTFIGPLLSSLGVPAVGATQWYVPSVGEYKAIEVLQAMENLPSEYTKISGYHLTLYVKDGKDQLYTYLIGNNNFNTITAISSNTRSLRPIFAIELNKDNFCELF